MKKNLLLIAILLTLALPSQALLTTNIMVPVAISTLVTNGQTIAFYTFSLPPPKFILNSYQNITNVPFGTNSLGFGANVSVTPSSWYNFAANSTNGQTDTHSGSEITNSQFTVTVTGSVTNAPGTNFVQEQLQF